MFGKNEVAHKMHDADGKLLVNEIFYTFQGEGPDAGRPAVFVRLAKCNLRCYFCDTDFEKGTMLTAREAFERIVKILKPDVCNLVVITGGEPLLQNILPLVQRLNSICVSVAVETAGTIGVPGMSEVFKHDRSYAGNIIVVSPKTPKISEVVERCAGAFKYIIRKGETSADDGLPLMSTQTPGEPVTIARPIYSRLPPVSIYVQAMDEQDPVKTQENIEWAASIVLEHGYRLSVQTHKLAGVP
jgi:7-carboxy-7-deazaguanine synthase